MKSNKPLTNKTFDFLKWLKPCLIAMLIVVAVAGIIGGIFGFNKGFDFTGGTQLVVSFPYDKQIETQEGLDKTSTEIKEILSKNGVSVNSVQVQGEYAEKSLVFTFTEKDNDVVRKIRLEINKYYNTSEHYAELSDDQKYKILDDENYSNYDITKQTTQVESLLSAGVVLTTISTLLFALIIAMIYALIRFKTAGGLALVFAGIVDIVLTVAFVLITRVEINTYFFGALGLVLLLSVYLSADFLFNIKQKTKDPMLTDKDNYELASSTVNENLVKTIIVGSMAVAISLIFGVIATINVLHLALLSIVGVAVCFATHTFVLPAFWASINKKRELSRPAAILNNKDKDAEEVEVVEEENDEDNDAEVVEVKD